MDDITDGRGAKALALVQRLSDLGIEGGAPGLKSAIELADEYRAKTSYADDEARIAAIVRHHVVLAGGSGFATGLGGIASLPVTLPAGMTAAWVLQARMIGCIAHMRGHDLTDERVRVVCLAALAGDRAVAEVMKEVAKDIATRGGKAAVMRVPGALLIRINKLVGFRLITKAGKTGSINLIRVVPVLGGVSGGAVDAAATRAVAEVAKRAFPLTGEATDEECSGVTGPPLDRPKFSVGRLTGAARSQQRSAASA